MSDQTARASKTGNTQQAEHTVCSTKELDSLKSFLSIQLRVSPIVSSRLLQFTRDTLLFVLAAIAMFLCCEFNPDMSLVLGAVAGFLLAFIVSPLSKTYEGEA